MLGWARTRRARMLGLAAITGATVVTAGATSPAMAVNTGPTNAHVVVASGIVLENLTTDFPLSGPVGATVDTGMSGQGPDVTMTVISNTAYHVTINPVGAGMTGPDGATTTTIPWATLQVADATNAPPLPAY